MEQAPHPWERVSLSDYEACMTRKPACMLQALDELMQIQLERWPLPRVTVLGPAGGTGLKHVSPHCNEKLVCVDVNPEFLSACAKRHADMGSRLSCIRADLTVPGLSLPAADLLIANLTIEYIGYQHFLRAVRMSVAGAVSCVIEDSSVPPLCCEAFPQLRSIYRPVRETLLTEAMSEAAYHLSSRDAFQLPDGRRLILLDYIKHARCSMQPG